MLEIQQFISMSNEGENLLSQIYLHAILFSAFYKNKYKQSPRITAGVIREDRQTNCVSLSD